MTDQPEPMDTKTVESKIPDNANMTNQPVTGGGSGGSEPTAPAFDYNVLLQEKEERQKEFPAMNPETKMETTLQKIEATMFTDSAGRKIPTSHAYLRINDEAPSSPSKEQTELLERLLRTSIKFSKEIGHDDDNCPTRPLRTCRRCQQPGHIAEDCPQPRKALRYNCGKPGHITRFCRIAKTCFRCGEEGHEMNECKNEWLETAMECAICRHCEEKGHFSWHCAERRRCGKCRSTNHYTADCVTGLHCSLCSSDEHASANCQARGVFCVKCYCIGHLEADCRVKPKRKTPRADGKVPRRSIHSLVPSTKTKKSCKPLTTDFSVKLQQVLSGDWKSGK